MVSAAAEDHWGWGCAARGRSWQVLLVLAGLTAAPIAQADAGRTIYVHPATGAGCSDDPAVAGTQAVPFCTLQTAVDQANAGDTVQAAAGTYPALTVHHSGTAFGSQRRGRAASAEPGRVVARLTGRPCTAASAGIST